MKIDLITSMAVLWGATGMFIAAVQAARAADDDRDGNLPQVLTPSRLPQRLDEAPSTVTIIDRAMIEASGARRLVDVLRLVPGLQVGYKTNSLPTATYHGLSDEYARRTLLLLNGQRIFQYSRGVIEWNNLPIPLENIERIEVVRGPAAAAYGSNALQAVINIQTGSAAEYPGLSTRVAAGGAGIADGFLRYGGRVGAMDYTLSLSSVGDHGYPGVYDDRRNNSLSFLGEVPLEAGGELKLQAGFARGDYGIQDPDPTFPAPARDFPVTDAFQSVQWRRPGTANDEWTLTLSHNVFHYGDRGFRNDQLLPGVTLRFDYDIQEERYEADAQYLRRFSDRWRTVAGFGYYHEAVRSPRYFDTDATLDNAVSWLSGHGEYRIDPAWVLNAGAMLEYCLAVGLVAVPAPVVGPLPCGQPANPALGLFDGFASADALRKQRPGHHSRGERAVDDLWRDRQRRTRPGNQPFFGGGLSLAGRPEPVRCAPVSRTLFRLHRDLLPARARGANHAARGSAGFRQ